MYTTENLPHGCMVVLAGATYTKQTEGIRTLLTGKRRETGTEIRARLDRGVSEGELPADTDTTELAEFYTTVLYGLSIRARDGAGYDDLTGAVDRAMTAWPTGGNLPADHIRRNAAIRSVS